MALNFQMALRDSGICSKFISLPMRREVQAIKDGQLDGAALRVPSFKDLVGNAAVMIDEPLATGSGLLISLNPSFKALERLAGHTLGMRMGVKWQMDLVTKGINVYHARSYRHLVEMLRQKRIDSILIDSIAVQEFKAELVGATMTPLVDLSGHVWIRTSLQHRAKEIAEAIRAYRAKGRTFIDAPVTQP